MIFELENLETNSDEIVYKFNKDIKVTINQRNNLIDKLFRVLIKIIKKSTNLNLLGNFDESLVKTFKKILQNKNIIENNDYIPSIINFIYFFIKVSNCFPSKIPFYINNNIFDLIIIYFQNNFPKYDGTIHLIFLMFYTICIHNEGKAYLKNNIEKIKIFFEKIFEKIENNENYFYYNLFVLKDLHKYELYSPYNALLHIDGINEIINIIFQNLKKYMEKVKEELNNVKIKRTKNIILDKYLYFIEAKRSFIDEFFISFQEKDIELFENNLKIEITEILKLYLDIILSTVSLYCLSSHFVIIKPVFALSKKYPIFVLDKLYEKFMELLNEKYDLEEVQISKIFSTLQKIFEEIFSKLYQKTENNELISNLDKYSLLSAKLIIKMIISKKSLSSYLSPINDRQLMIYSKYYMKFISKKLAPQFRDLLISLSYRILNKYAPHTTNPHLYIINEDNYQDIRCPVDLNQKITMEILNNSFFFVELLRSENKINNYLLTSVEYFYSLGKTSKLKLLKDIKEPDISRIKNYIKLGYILSYIIKYFGETYEINQISNTNDSIENILVNLSLFNYINILMNGKMNKNLSSIVYFYFIKYGGIRHIFSISKKFLYFCKTEFDKKEIPMIKLLIIKNFWNIIISLLLLLIKYQFYNSDNLPVLSILEHDLVKNFVSLNEFDAYVKYLILNDFFEVFFDKNDYDKNIEMIKDIEKYCAELTRMFYILLDRCVRSYEIIYNSQKSNIKINELCNQGYYIYEILKVIQEGKKTNEDIIKAINEYRNNENEDEIKRQKEENDKEDNNNNKVDDNTKQNQEIEKNLNINSIIEQNNKDKNKSEIKDKKIINKCLYALEQTNLNQDIYLINNINNIFPENNYIQKKVDLDLNNKNNSFSKNDLLTSLNLIYQIFDKCSTSNKNINDMKKMNIKYRIKSFEEKEDLLPYLEEILSIIKNLQQEKNKNNGLNKEEIFKKELSYIKFMNYSILRYKTLTKFYEIVDIKNYIDLIYNNNLIENSANSIKELINNKHIINIELIKKLIYEYFLRTYILFCFLEHNKKNFEKEKIIFLDSFLFLLKESNDIYNAENKFIYNEAIIILGFQIIIQFFNNNDKSGEFLAEYLTKKNLFKYLLELKFNSEDANSNFYENEFRYFITLEESFRQFISKIFSEKNIFGHLLESVFKYIIANINPENNEIELENFISLLSDYVKIDNEDIIINSIKNIFIKREQKNIIDKNLYLYFLKLKPEFVEEIEKMKEEINKGEINKNEFKKKIKNKEELNLSKGVSKFEEKGKIIKFKWSENNKELFNNLLEHIYTTCELIKKDILKEEKFQKFSRNYLFDLDTSLSGLNCILHVYPSFIYLLFQFKCGKKSDMNFIKYLINELSLLRIMAQSCKS